jgi:hypothetical protein
MALAFLVVPVFFFAEHALPGFPLAQGCGAAGNDAGGRFIVRSSGETSVDVATDGFFALVPSPKLMVTVMTLDGAVVEGSIDGFGWHASAPLAIGTTLRAVVATVPARDTPVVTDEVELSVVGEPPAVTATGLTFGDWHAYAEPVGELVECTPPDSADPCDDGSVRAPAAVELVDVVDMHWSPPPGASSYAMWELTIDLDAIDDANFERSAGLAINRLVEQDLGWLRFPLGAERYCVTLTVRDLRTGETASAETCAEPQAPTSVLRDYELSRCEQPPSQAMTEEWCDEHPESSLPACSGQPGEPSAGGASPNEPAANPAGARKPRTSEGCQVSSNPARSAGCLTLLVLFGAAALGRRLKAQR